MTVLNDIAGPGNEHELEACMARRRNLEQIFKAMGDGVIAVNCDGLIFQCNDAVATILGIDATTARDMLAEASVDRVLSEYADQEVDVVARALTSGEPIGPESIRIRPVGSRRRRLTVNVRPLREEDSDAAVGAVLLLHDESEVDRLRADLQQVRGPGNIVGASRPMQQVFTLIREVARTEATVLIEGETGTGKELVANAIHQLSDRADGPMITVNCAALPEGLLESELFGHVKGAFTGAVSDRAGRFELASGGTLFLDEIAEVPQMVQVKLLRVLQERTYERVGEGKPRVADVRLISATNRSLADEVAEERFREDLFYRLNIFPILLPPLRDRVDDVPLLIGAIFDRMVERSGYDRAPAVSEDSLSILRNHAWPGNVRELQAAMEYALIRSHGDIIEPEHLPAHLLHAPSGAPATECIVNEETIQMALDRFDGSRTRAAESLGISRVTLWRRMKEFGLV